MRMRPIAVLVAFATLSLAACGGSTSTSSSGGGSLPETASFAPASSAFYASFDTDVNGEQWQKALALLNRFPSHDKAIAELGKSLKGDGGPDWETELKPALGPEVGLVALAADSDTIVLFTQSPQPAKLEELLKRGNDPAVSREIDGYVVAADTAKTLDRFAAAHQGGSLAEEGAFKDAVDGVDLDGIALAYVPGSTITTGLGDAIRSQGTGLPAGTVDSLGKIKSVAASASAEDNGVQFDVTLESPDTPTTGSFNPSLDETLPAKPLLFVSAAHLDKLLRQALDQVGKSVPNFDQQRAQMEQALGLTLDGDVLPLFSKEIALGVYGEASGTVPVTVDLVLSVDDEAKASKLMTRLGALAQLGGGGTTRKVQVGGAEATELDFGEFSIFWIVGDGKLEISTSQAGLEKLRSSSGRLSDDPAYKSQLDAAGVPDEVTGLVYSDLQTAVPYVLNFAGSDVDAETKANLEPLRSVVASSSQDGDTVHLGGFVGIG